MVGTLKKFVSILLLTQFLFVNESLADCESDRMNEINTIREYCAAPVCGANVPAAWVPHILESLVYPSAPDLRLLVCYSVGCNNGVFNSQISNTAYSVYLRTCGLPNLAPIQKFAIGQCPVVKKGSIIKVDTQVLGEVIPVVGTNFNLYYFSDRDRGRVGSYNVQIALSNDLIRTSVLSYDVVIKDLDGNTYSSVNVPNTTLNNTYTYTWDGKDLAGNDVLYPKKFKAIIRENYASFSLEHPSDVTLGVVDSKNIYGIGGWQPNILQFYNFNDQTLYSGDGSSRAVQAKEISAGLFYVPEFDASVIYYFDSNGRHIYTKTRLTGSTVYTFNYDSSGRLISIAEPFSRVTTFNRDWNGKLTSITSPKGQQSAVVLNSADYLQSITNPSNEVYNMTYWSGNGLLKTFQKPAGQANTFNYDSEGYLIQDSHSGGFFQQLVNTYPTIQVNTPMGRQSSIRYSGNAVNFSSVSTNPDGTIDYVYETPGVNSALSFQSKGITTNNNYSPDAQFNSAKFQTYDAFYLSSILNGSISRTQSVVLANPTDPFSLSTMSITSTHGNKTVTSSYSAAANKWNFVTGLGRSAELGLDSYERPASLKVGSLENIQLGYLNENLSSVTQGSRTTNFSYNSATGDLQGFTNSLGETTGFVYDNVGRVTAKVFPDSRVIGYSYDANSNVASITPPGRQPHYFSLNGHELPGAYLPPAIPQTSMPNTTYFYNLDKQVTKITRPANENILFNYNNSTGFLNQITSPTGNFDFTMNTSNGLPGIIKSPSGLSTNLTYAGSILMADGLYNSQGLTLGNYSRVFTGDLLTSDFVAGANGIGITINYQYDNDRNLIKAGDLSLTYNENNQIVGTSIGTAANEITDHYTYNEFGEVTNYEVKRGTTLIYKYDLLRDALGRVTQKTQLLNGQTNVWSYTYDSSGRLTGAVKNGVAYSSYTYDSNSNRIGGFVGAQPTTATYDSQDRLTQYNIFNYTYKSNGDLYQKKNTLTNYMNSYIFDTYGNFKKYYNGDLPASSYDHDGRNRIAGRLWNGNNVYARYIYKDQYHIAGELNDTSQLSKRFVYASKSNIPDYMIVGGVNYRIISDNLGSQRLVIRLTDGAVSSWMDHDEFGKVTGSYNAYLPFGFAGGYYNANDGLVRFGARTYDPEVGRWLSKDPILFNGGDTNLYGYVFQDPVNFLDPDGLRSVTFSLFLGLGGSITIGKNAKGPWFGTARVGIGAGTGLSYDPEGETPDGSCPGIATGVYAEAGGHFGIFESSITTSSGFSQSMGQYYNPPKFSPTATPSIGFGFGYSGGFEMSFH
jgi:RHS repeat-associated protein